MNKGIYSIANGGKTAKNEQKNDDSDFLQALYSVYKNQDNSFSILSR